MGPARHRYRPGHGLPQRDGGRFGRSGAERQADRRLELVEHALDQIARHNPTLNAFVAVDGERARAAAEAIDRQGGGRASTRARWPASRSG